MLIALLKQKNTEAGIFLNYDEYNNSQGYAKKNEAFRALTKVDILKQNI